jgi:hypothetical protein
MSGFVDVMTLLKGKFPDTPFTRLLNESEVQYVCNEPHAIFMQSILPEKDSKDAGEEKAS